MQNAISDKTEFLSDNATRIDVRHITVEQLQQLGVAQVAYVKPVRMNGEAAFAIHSADGQPMAVAMDQDLAVAAIQQHDMVPLLVH